jgi:hypothetical protein
MGRFVMGRFEPGTFHALERFEFRMLHDGVS